MQPLFAFKVPVVLFGRMKFKELAVVLTVLLRSFGEVCDQDGTHFQEECAGEGNLTAGVRLFHLNAARRDVVCQHARGFILFLVWMFHISP